MNTQGSCGTGGRASRGVLKRIRSFVVAGGALGFFAVSAFPSTASGGPPSQAAGFQKFEQGKRAFDAGRFEEALLAFQASIETLPSPNSRLYIARCYRALDKPARAYVEYQRAQREAEDRRLATGEARFAATRDTAAQEAAKLEPRVPRLTLAVPSDAPGAMRIQVDKEDLPRTVWGTAVETDPGKHEIFISGGRVRPQTLTVELKPGEKQRFEVKLERLPTSVLHLQLKSRPSGLAVEIDKVALDPKQFDAKQEVDAGEHTIVVHAPGYVPFVWKKVTVDGETAQIPVDLGASRGPPKWVFYTTGAAAIGLLGVGAGLALDATLSANAENAKDPLLRDPVVRDRIRLDSFAANTLFIAGGAAAIGAVALFFFTDLRAPSAESGGASVHVTPWIAERAGGLIATGLF